MTATDTRARATALRMIAKYGKAITFTSITAGSYDPATGAATPTSAAVTIKAVVDDYSAGAIFQAGGMILSGDKKFTIAASALTTKPKPGDTITLDSVVFALTRITETWSGEQIALYECQGRI